MYHELEIAGRALCQNEPGYVRYVLPAATFEAQMRFLGELGWRGVSVGSAREAPAPRTVAVTFDDGCQTDLLLAAPLLRALGYGATFYVTAGFIGRPGYMSASQVRELQSLGFEIGCHSMTHAYLSDLDEPSMEHEIVEAKSRLEQILGTPVAHFSCPGGRHDSRVAAKVKSAGYQTMATSRPRRNSQSTDAFSLGRVAVLRNMDIRSFAKLCRGEALWKLSVRDGLRHTVRSVFGNAAYDHIRAALLRH